MKLVKGWKKVYPETAKALGEVIDSIDEQISYVIQIDPECMCEDCVLEQAIQGREKADAVLAELIKTVGASSLIGNAAFDGVLEGIAIRKEEAGLEATVEDVIFGADLEE